MRQRIVQVPRTTGLVACLALCFAACDGDRPGTVPVRTQQLLRIAVLAEGKDDPTWPVVVMTSRRFADRHTRVSVEVVAPDVASPKRQQELLAALGGGRCDVVCVCPTDPAAMRSVIGELAQTGTPVITFGRDVRGSNRVSYCGPHEDDVGEAAAEACGAHVNETSRAVIVLSPGADDAQYGKRHRAFARSLTALGTADVLRSVAPGEDGWQTSQRVRDEARRFPRVAAWVFLDDWPFRREPDEVRLVPRDCAIVLCNGSPRHFDQVRSGNVQALVAFDFHRALEGALLMAMDTASKPETHPPGIDIPVEIVTRSNLRQHARRWVVWERGEPTPE